MGGTNTCRIAGITPNQILLGRSLHSGEALNRLNGLGVTIFCHTQRPKAISDSFAIGALTPTSARAIYQRMTADVDVPTAGIYGYGQSEALVSMKKTPDNITHILV